MTGVLVKKTRYTPPTFLVLGSVIDQQLPPPVGQNPHRGVRPTRRSRSLAVWVYPAIPCHRREPGPKAATQRTDTDRADRPPPDVQEYPAAGQNLCLPSAIVCRAAWTDKERAASSSQEVQGTRNQPASHIPQGLTSKPLYGRRAAVSGDQTSCRRR